MAGNLPAFALRSEAAKVELRVVRATPETALATLDRQRAAGRPLEVVLCDLDLFEEPVTDGIAALCRRLTVPLVTRGHAGPDLLLELAAVGVATHLAPDLPPAAVVARLLVTLDRHLTERELRRGYAAFRRVFDQLDIAFAIIDGSTRFIGINPALRRLLGYGEGEMAAMTVADLTHRGDRGGLRLLQEVVTRQRERCRVRIRCLRADGGEVSVLVSASRFYDPVADEPRVIAEFQDLSHEVAARLERDRARESFWCLFEHNPLPSLMLDLRSFRFTAANLAAQEMIGDGAGEIEGMPLRRLLADGEAVTSLEAHLEGDDPFPGPSRVRIRRGHGSSLEVEITTVRVDHDGRPGRLLLLREAGSERVPAGRVGSEARVGAAGTSPEVLGPGPSVPGSTGPGARILLVDDDAAVRFLVQEMMRSQGYEVETVDTAEEALDRAERDRPYDVVVTDASMPGMSGVELVGQLRARSPGLRILVMSGHPGRTLSQLGDLPFLAKPFTAQDLSRRLGEILADRES